MATETKLKLSVKVDTEVPKGKPARKKKAVAKKKKPRAKAKFDDGRLGNSFWKLRSRHGRERLFKTPNLLWQAACEYFEWCEQNPWIKVEQTKTPSKPFKDPETKEVKFASQITELPVSRPYTITGLCIYLDCNSMYFNQFKESIKDSDSKVNKDFSLVITRIEEIMYTQKFEGAAIGAFNSSIIARDLGLVDKKDIDHKTNGESLNKTKPMTDDELRAFKKRFDEI